MLIKIAIIEYAVLGVLAGLIGSAAAVAVTSAMTEFGRLRIPWHPQPFVNILGAASTALLVTIVGVLASWNVIVNKPLGTLREQ